MAEKMTARALTDLAKFLAGVLAKGGSAKALAGIGNAARRSMKDILKFSAAMEDLRQKTGGSYREAEKLLGYYNRLAKELGATTLQVKKAADVWLRQGKSAAQAGELARQAITRARGGMERGGLAPLERLEDRTNRLRAAFESLSMEPLADAAGDIDAAAAGVAALLEKTGRLKNTLDGIDATQAVQAAAGLAASLIEACSNAAKLSSALALLDKLPQMADRSAALEKMGVLTKSLADEQLRLLFSRQQMSAGDAEQVLRYQGLTQEAAKAKKEALDLDYFGAAKAVAKAAAQGGKGFSLKGLMESIGGKIAANPLGAVITGVEIAVKVVDKLQQNAREAVAYADALTKAYSANVAAIDGQLLALGEKQARFQALQKGVTPDHRNAGLTGEEFAEYSSILAQLVELNPGLVQGYDEQNRAIIAQNVSIEEQIALLREKRQLEDKRLLAQSHNVFGAYHDKTANPFTWLNYDESFAKQMDGARQVMDRLEEAAREWDGAGKLPVNFNLGQTTVSAFLKGLGIKPNLAGKFLLTPEDVKRIRAGYAALVENINLETDKIKPIAEASLHLDERYQGLPAQLKNALDAAAGNLDTAFYQSFQGDVSAMAQWFADNLLGPLAENAGQVQSALSAAFAVDDALASGEAKVKSYLAAVEGAAADVFGAFGEGQRRALSAKGLGAADMAGLFGFGQYAQQAREMMDGVSAALGAPVAQQLLESLGYSQLQTLSNTIRDIAAQGEDVSRYAGMFLKAYTDPQLAGPLNALEKTLDNGQVSQEAFNQKVRELGEAAGLAGPVLERFVGLFARAPEAVAGMSQSLDGAQEKLHGFAGIDSFLTAVADAYNTPQIGEMAADIQQVNRQLQEGALLAGDYFNALAGRTASFSWEGLQGDEGAQAMFTGLAMATAQGMEFIESQFAGGSLDVGQYTRALGEATGNLLQMRVATENLSQGQDGLWRDSAGRADEYANALAASLEGLRAFAPMVDVLTANAGYLQEHMDSMGQAAFTAAGTAGSAFLQLSGEVETALEALYKTNQEAFWAVVENIAQACGVLTADVADANGDVNTSLLQTQQGLNAALNASMGQMSAAMSGTRGAAANVLRQLGELIKNFRFSITFTPKMKGKFSGLDLLRGKLPAFGYEITGNGGEAFGQAMAEFADTIGAANAQMPPLTLNNFKVAVPQANPAAPRILSQAAGGQREVNKALQEYLRLLSHQKAMGDYDDDPQGYIGQMQYALDHYAKSQEEIWDLEERIHSAKKQMIEEERRKRAEAAQERKRRAREAYEEEKRLAQEAYQAEGDRLKEHKSQLEGAYSAAGQALDDEIKRLRKITQELDKQLQLKKDRYDSALAAVLGVLDKQIEGIKKENELQQALKEQLGQENEKYQGAHAAILSLLDRECDKLREQLELVGKAAQRKDEEARQGHAAVLGVLEEEIKKLQQQKALLNERYQPKIDALQDEIDKLNEANDARRKAYEYEKAQQELERLKNQKTSLLYREGQGFVYEADAAAVMQAQEQVRELELQQKLDALESQKGLLLKQLEEEKRAYDAQIEALEEYQEQWSGVLDAYEKQQNREIAQRLFGAGWEERILSGRLDILEGFKNRYFEIQQELAQAKEEQEALQGKIDGIEDYKQKWAELLEQYKNKQNQLHVSEILGAGWEKKILGQRLDVLEIFGQGYLAIQEKLCDTTKQEEANNKQIELLEAYRQAWSGFVDSYQSEQDRYNASQILGAAWEQDILNQRMGVFTAFRDAYVGILNQLNDVEAERQAYEERIGRLQEYKEALAEAVDAYQAQQDRLAAAQLWGADWEKQILDGRLETLNAFKSAYISVMQELADWEARKPDFPDFDDWYDDDYDDYEDDEPKRPSRPSNRPGDDDEDEGGSMPRVGERVTVRGSETHWATGERMHSWVPGHTLTVMQVKGNRVLVGQGGQWTGWLKASQLKGYQYGTLSAAGGIAVTDEAGPEIKVRLHPDKGRLTTLEAGDGVLPSNPTRKLLRLCEAADGLRALAQDPGKTMTLDLAGLAFPGLMRLQEEIKGALPPAPPAPAAPAAPRAETYHFHIDRLDFPNVKDISEIERAFRELPARAAQFAYKRK